MSEYKEPFNLQALIDLYLIEPRVRRNRPVAYYPTEASVQCMDPITGEPSVSGKCMRAAYYRCSGDFERAETSPRQEMIFKLGKNVENVLVDVLKEMGLWKQNNLKFWNEEFNVSGEIDILLRDPETNGLFGAEVKSIYGYYAKKEIFGNKKQAGRPKIEHVLQSAIYLDNFSDIIKYWKLVYMERGDGSRCEFNITLAKDLQGKTRICVNGEPIKLFTLEDVYARYKLLDNHRKRDTIPPRDYDLVYPPQKVEAKNERGELSKSKYDNWKRNPVKNPIGDWQCSYCPFRLECWGQD